MMEPQVEPFFTNDLIGFVKLLFSVIAAAMPAVGLMGWWLKRGSDRRIDSVELNLNGLGRRVDVVEQDQSLQVAWRATYRENAIRLEEDTKAFRERLAKAEGAMERMQKDVAEHHQEQRSLIQETARAQMEALHKVELQVARLNERNNIGDSLTELGNSIERAVRIAMHREDGPG